MPRVTMTCNDAFLFGALGYSIVVLAVKWSHYAACSKPLQLFLLVDYATIILFRLSHFVVQYFSDSALRPYVLFVKVGLIYPFFCAWTILGTVWFSQSGSCLPESNQYWTFIIWLIICYLWITLYACLLKLQRYMGYAGGDFHPAVGDNGFPIHLIPEVPSGLTPQQLESIPTFSAEQQDCSTCSICLENIEIGDFMKRIECHHSFHAHCIDSWLSRKNNCPNCRVVVTERSLRPSPQNETQDQYGTTVEMSEI